MAENERCPLCNQEFESGEELRHHDSEMHGGNDARDRAEERQREPAADSGAPGGNAVVDPLTGQARST